MEMGGVINKLGDILIPKKRCSAVFGLPDPALESATVSTGVSERQA